VTPLVAWSIGELTQGSLSADTPDMPFLTASPLRVLLLAQNDQQVHLIRSALDASKILRFQVVHASNSWDAQCEAVDGRYDGVVLDHAFGDIDSEALLGRLKALGVSAPALLLTSTDRDQAAAGCDEYLPRTDALNGDMLARVIVAMIQRRDLTNELAASRDQGARATMVLTELAHDLATPLGVIMGMSQMLLSDEKELTDDGRACLEDVSQAALRACEILDLIGHVKPGADAVAPSTVYPPDHGRASKVGPGSKLVLIADDDPATRHLVCATLLSDQICVLQAADGEEAWRLIREHHPAVAILDWQMPVYSGLELTDVIKGDPQVSGMTVIMLTGRNTPADREAGALARADLYLVKPFSPQELLGAVEQGLRVN
jgi:DNA-binding response OmpR family regulator